METEKIQSRRLEEIEALRAYYGHDLSSTLAPSSQSCEPDDDIPLDGPWFLRIRHHENDNNESSLGTPTLEIRLSPCYPMGETPPTPVLHNVMMNQQLKWEFLQELQDTYEGFEVGILWGERCREELLSSDVTIDAGKDAENNETESDIGIQNDESTRTFIPSSTKFSQPIRQFPAEFIENSAYKREIIHTPPFYPPKSGPSEIMIAHVCGVHCTEHVQWALAELLFNDKKVARASHNMLAYRFTSDGIMVSDDDELSGVENVLVVVSRWYGIHLGPARFKHIASVAREGLGIGGFLKDGG